MPAIRSAVSGVAWPAITEPVAASLLALLRQFEESEHWPEERLHSHQFEQLQQIWDHARRTVPWYSKQPTIAGPISSWSDFRQLPVVSRHEVQRAGHAMRSSTPPREHGSLIPFATSGTLGTPLEGVETEVSHFFWNAINLREQLWQGRELERRFGAIRTKVAEARLADWGDPVARVFVTGDAVTLNIARPVAAQATWLRRERPDYLLSHPSNLHALARHFLQESDTPPLRGIGSFGEALAPAVRSLCTDVFGSPIADIYSAEEVGYIALQCEQRQGYHLMAENLIVEVLDSSGNPCGPGTTGRVVITTLHNFAMPLIRYEIGDYAQVGTPCPCGRTLPTLERIAGRERNMLIRADGDLVWPSFPAELWLAASPVQQFQLRQQRRDLVVVRYAAPRALTDRECADLSSRLAASLPFDGLLRFERTDRMTAAPNGKFEDFVREISTDDTPNLPSSIHR